MYKSGSYRFVDNPNNLCLRLRIRKSPTHKLLENGSFDGSDSDSDTYEEYSIKWQQKIFSQKEIEWFKVDRNYDKFLERTYHTQVNKQKYYRSHDYDIFTITENDLSLDSWTHLLDKKDFGCKQRSMYIMLELRNDSNQLLMSKISIQTIQKLLNVCPEFNSISQPYILKNKNLTAQGTFHMDYVIDIAPDKLTRNEISMRNVLLEKLRISLVNTGSMFTLKPKGISFEPVLTDSILHINGEIEFAKDFEYKNLCVCFYIEPQSNGSLIDSNELCFFGITQKCFVNNNGKANFSMPFSTCIQYNSEHILLEKWPTIYFKVLSFDYFNRLICQSFGSLIIPRKIGRFSVAVKTWKLSMNNPIDRLKHFFIGSSPKIQDFEPTVTSNIMNKYGFRNQSSGIIHLNFDVIMRTELSVKDRNINKFDDLLFDSNKENILSVVNAFQRAKQRMDLIRNKMKISKL